MQLLAWQAGMLLFTDTKATFICVAASSLLHQKLAMQSLLLAFTTLATMLFIFADSFASGRVAIHR